MSDNKKYYYLKLKESHFDSDQMVVLESMPDGYKYSNILLKLYLRSLKNGGKLMFNDRIPFNSTMLSTITRHSIGDIEKAVKIFQELDLIEVLNNGAIYMSDIQNYIGESSTEADRKRAFRGKIEHEKKKIKNKKARGTNVRQMSDKNPPEIESDLELKKELEPSLLLSPKNEIERVDFKTFKKNILEFCPNFGFSLVGKLGYSVDHQGFCFKNGLIFDLHKNNLLSKEESLEIWNYLYSVRVKVFEQAAIQNNQKSAS